MFDLESVCKNSKNSKNSKNTQHSKSSKSSKTSKGSKEKTYNILRNYIEKNQGNCFSKNNKKYAYKYTRFISNAFTCLFKIF